MSWEDDLEPGLIGELPFYLAATIAYGAVLTLNPAVRWGSGKAPDAGVPIEFVAAVPLEAPSPNLAPPPSAGKGKVEPPPRKGEGDFVPEKVKAGARNAPPKPLPRPKPAAVKSNPEKRGSTMAKPRSKTKPVAKMIRAAPLPVDIKAIMAASIARRAKIEHAKEAKAAAAAAAAVLAERKAEEAREAAEVRAEIAREKAEAARAKAKRMADAKRARAEALAEAKAAEARKKAELSRELATMSDPDEALSQDSPPPAGGSSHMQAAAKAGAAAALADTAASADPGDAAGSGGGDLLDARAKGGGTGPDGAGVSYSLDGPVGSRRVLKRAVPSSPDWVGARGLDLTVTVRFQVLPDGAVKPGAVVRKTSGFPEIDRRALNALRKWRFESIPAGDGPEVWGRVTFRFTS